MKRALLSLGMGFALRPIALGLDAGNSAYITNTPTAIPAPIAARNDGHPLSMVSDGSSLSATFVDKLSYSAHSSFSYGVCR